MSARFAVRLHAADATVVLEPVPHRRRDGVLGRQVSIIVAGDDAEPVFARVVDIVGDTPDRKVHLDVLPAAPERYLEASARSRLVAH